MGETVDVLVIGAGRPGLFVLTLTWESQGANYGKRGTGGVSTLICGVLDDRREADEGEPKSIYLLSIGDKREYNKSLYRYSSFVRIGTGLSYADYVWVRAKPWKPFDKKNPPSWYQVAKRGIEDKGDVYLEPEEYEQIFIWRKMMIYGI